MNATQKIKREILQEAQKHNPEEFDFGDLLTGDLVDRAYEALQDADAHWDFESEFRCGQVETGLPCEWSRHYESKAVSRKLSDGSWVGWTYWYGGGKHGEPEAINWMEDAYDVECREEEQLVVVRTFTKSAEAVKREEGEK